MDNISKELHEFLIQLGKDPHCVSHTIEHYVKHLLHLLTSEDETIFRQYYGLFGEDVTKLEDIARRRSMSTDMMEKIIEADLRKIAITPEWQMIRQLIDKQ